jgi:hypothetical protein
MMASAATTPPVASAQVVAEPTGSHSAEVEKPGKPTEKTPWISLTDNWKACQFGGEGDVTIKDGVIKLEFGDPLTGVRWEGVFEGDKPDDGEPKSKNPRQLKVNTEQAKPLPRDNYELRWECRRDKGWDFVCAFTFPVADSHASLVMGGWGGGITGISSIDGRDASDNETTKFISFDDQQWYNARVRVETEKITVWVDEKQLFDHPRKGHAFDIRFEMDLCTPLGIANYQCESQIRKIQIRRLHPSEIAKAEKKDE